MTTEQREAIERLKDDIKHAELRDAVDDDCTVCFTEDVDTILSLIKEQQEEIERLKTDNGNVWQLNANMSKRHLKDICKLKQKDKQIDLMANSILAREIGKNSCQFNETCIKFEKGRDTHCKDCIKQYFERKVEEC